MLVAAIQQSRILSCASGNRARQKPPNTPLLEPLMSLCKWKTHICLKTSSTTGKSVCEIEEETICQKTKQKEEA
jgi:hypothetical protein